MANEHNTQLAGEVKEKLRKLAEVSKKLEQYASAQSAATNVMQACEIKKRVDELTARQDDLVLSLVEMHQDKARRDEVIALSDRLEEYRLQVKACQNAQELEELKEAIDKTVDEWILKFQNLVSDLVGLEPPKSPVRGDKNLGL